MKNTTTLEEAREEAFTEALESYVFGKGVECVDNDSFEKDGDVWSCRIYLDDVEFDETVACSFTVWFDRYTDEVIDVDYQVL
jgi:hypothetical protein